MGLKRRLLNRRTFMATGAAAGVGSAAWLAMSSSWGARFLRQRFDEIGRDIPSAPHKPTPATWSDNAVTLAWLGHEADIERALSDGAVVRLEAVPIGVTKPKRG